MWEYLQTKDLDLRFLITAGYLSKKIAGKHIVDLNCGTARLLNYLPDVVFRYFGNDINKSFLLPHPKAEFLNLNDQKMVEWLAKEKVDILCLFGHGAGNKLECEFESPSLTDSAFKIIEDHRPEIVIAEGYLEYDLKFKMVSEIKDRCLEFFGYRLAFSAVVRPYNYKEGLSHRCLFILEKK